MFHKMEKSDYLRLESRFKGFLKTVGDSSILSTDRILDGSNSPSCIKRVYDEPESHVSNDFHSIFLAHRIYSDLTKLFSLYKEVKTMPDISEGFDERLCQLSASARELWEMPRYQFGPYNRTFLRLCDGKCSFRERFDWLRSRADCSVEDQEYYRAWCDNGPILNFFVKSGDVMRHAYGALNPCAQKLNRIKDIEGDMTEPSRLVRRSEAFNRIGIRCRTALETLPLDRLKRNAQLGDFFAKDAYERALKYRGITGSEIEQLLADFES